MTNLYGRDHELDLVERELGRLADGLPMSLIVEGAAGIGKSRVLAELADRARVRGIRVFSGNADPNESVVELSTLLAALSGGTDPLLHDEALASLSSRPEQRFWLLRDLRAILERAALESPLLIAIDDVQWIDGGSAAALRELPIRLSDLPIGWAIATRLSVDSPSVLGALDYLEKSGAIKISLGPLEPKAVFALTEEILGGKPGEGVLALADEAAGNPFLLVEMMLGLEEENRVRRAGGRLDISESGAPRRVEEKMRGRLERLSERARDAISVAASLGRQFSFSDIAQMLESQPATLLQPIRELIGVNLLVESGDELAFWHDITRDAVRASVPASVRRSLDRQAAGMLLGRGALPVEVAIQLFESAEPGDEVAVATLLEAASALRTTDPATSARFARRALEILPADHPRRGEIVADAAIAMHASASSDEAVAFADRALREALPPVQEAEVRLSIAGMFLISPAVRIAAARAALALPDLPERIRTRGLVMLFYSMVVAGQAREALPLLDEARAALDRHPDPRAELFFRVAAGGYAYSGERFAEFLDLMTDAYRACAADGDDQLLRMVQLYRGEMHLLLDRDQTALDIAAEGLAAAQRDRQAWAYEMFETWRARVLIRSGRVAEARAILEAQYELEDGTRVSAALEAAGLVALGRASIHTGDSRQVRRLKEMAVVVAERGAPSIRQHALWLLAVIAYSEGDVPAARDWLGQSQGYPVLPRFPQDIADEILLAKIAVEAGDHHLVDIALANTERRRNANPGVASIAATAAHVRGIVHDDADALREAADLFSRSPRRFEHALAREDLGRMTMPSDREAGVASFSEALAIFVDLGATFDAGRVRSQLRAIGVRRRVITAEPETIGWASITAAELAVVRLVAQGMSNREVGEQLFLSSHTVNSHLRHVFQKLEISSRVELARLVLEHDGDWAPSRPRLKGATRNP